MSDRKSIIDKIKKLLALSGSPNKAEAESALRFAQELMKKYDIEVSDVERGEITAAPVDGNRGAVRAWDHKLLILIAHAHSCEYIRDEIGLRSIHLLLVGRTVNIEVSRLMYAYVKRCALSESRKIPLKKRNRFLQGFVMGIAYQVHTLGITWSPDEKEKIDSFITKRYENLTSQLFDKTKFSKAYADGVNGGASLNLQKQMSGTAPRGLIAHG